ncbi:MAG TPA: hypothetical protein VFJ16_12450, partial [Longimicrobium sp.]|nr:hypothetical protein [Longimicrobium sp.]
DAAAEANLEALDAINFCRDLWPTVKQGLEYLRDNVFSGITGVIIRAVINVIIRVVDGRCGG